MSTEAKRRAVELARIAVTADALKVGYELQFAVVKAFEGLPRSERFRMVAQLALLVRTASHGIPVEVIEERLKAFAEV